MNWPAGPMLAGGPHQARAAGVAMIYQELNLAPDLSVEDNIMLGREQHRFGWLRPIGRSGAWSREHARHAGHATICGPRSPVRPAFGRRAATGRDRPGAGGRRPRDRLRRADQFALAARRRAVVRGHRPAEAIAAWASSTSATFSKRSARWPTAIPCCATAAPWAAAR